VAKVSADGSALTYSTYLSGGTPDAGAAIAVDKAAGTAYVTGTTGQSFPATPGAFQTTPYNSTNAFVAELKSDGSTLVYATYLGATSYTDSSGQTSGTGIALDFNDQATVVGTTYASTFPTCPYRKRQLGRLAQTRNGLSLANCQRRKFGPPSELLPEVIAAFSAGTRAAPSSAGGA
jgi:hypothetical protein